MRTKNPEGATFKTLVTVFQSFCNEPDLDEAQLNVMQSTSRMLNAIDKRNTLNDGKDYKVCEQVEDFEFDYIEGNLYKFTENGFELCDEGLSVSDDVVEAYKLSLQDWKNEFIINEDKRYDDEIKQFKSEFEAEKNKEFDQWCDNYKQMEQPEQPAPSNEMADINNLAAMALEFQKDLSPELLKELINSIYLKSK